MEIIEKFLDEPRLSTFIKLCTHENIYNVLDTSIYMDVCITIILSMYPDLLWMIPYNFTPVKRNTGKNFNSKSSRGLCWAIFRSVCDKLQHKKLVID